MAEYANRETRFNNGLAGVVGAYALGIVDADNAAKDAYVARQIELMNQEEPNAEFVARTTLIGLDQALETRVSVPKIVLAPSRPIVIDEANVSMDMEVSASSSDSLAVNSSLEAEGSGSFGVGMFAAKMRVKASVSVAKDSKRDSHYAAITHADLRMVQGEAPEGMMKIIDSLNLTTAKALELNAELIEQQYLQLVGETQSEAA